MHRLPNCSTSRFVRQPSVCEGIKQSSFSLNIQLFFLPLPHACSGHVTAISSPPLNWQSKSLISVKVVSTMLIHSCKHYALSSTQYSRFIVRITRNQSDFSTPCPRRRPTFARTSCARLIDDVSIPPLFSILITSAAILYKLFRHNNVHAMYKLFRHLA